VEKGNAAFLHPAEISPKDFFQQFIYVFERKGWLHANLRIRHKGRRYRILCSGTEFLAYRINDNCGITPGIPGWPVCMINHERIIEDAHMSAFESTEPCAYEWLVHLADGAVEII
jgi:hypothetical protein